MWEVERMRSGVDGVDLDRGGHIGSGLLETEPQSADASEHIEHGWARHEERTLWRSLISKSERA